MPRSKAVPQPSREISAETMFVAMVIRNAMEDFHTKHLSDAQMAELNPIIRNAVATALDVYAKRDQHPGAALFYQFNAAMIPDFWEPPRFLDDYLFVLAGPGQVAKQ